MPKDTVFIQPHVHGTVDILDKSEELRRRLDARIAAAKRQPKHKDPSRMVDEVKFGLFLQNAVTVVKIEAECGLGQYSLPHHRPRGRPGKLEHDDRFLAEYGVRYSAERRYRLQAGVPAWKREEYYLETIRAQDEITSTAVRRIGKSLLPKAAPTNPELREKELERRPVVVSEPG